CVRESLSGTGFDYW
nr:immunoglobulin heavy chain junction region [Mus musculus]MBK4196287.1 immunoglobulin heavy chain junction region [Mus musculus]MBK4196288.1 immunoglobulin heavy chain junction region [Mus musculus]MBK4196289.1 immunoglobulin heavy chain junction region [Mus musculus]